MLLLLQTANDISTTGMIYGKSVYNQKSVCSYTNVGYIFNIKEKNMREKLNAINIEFDARS